LDFIKTKNLIFEYNQYDEQNQKYEKFRAIDNINLNIKKGDFVAILGHNGSGKSTFAKHINALLLPTEGTIWVNNIDTSNFEQIWEIRQNAGMVFQNPDNQLIATIVEEDVAFGPENLGIEPKEIRKRVDEAIKSVNMTEFALNSPDLLSGGQKQRVAIAGILAMKPKCIVLDEPTAMLDPAGRNEVIKTITMLNKEEGITIVLITHYMEETVNADRVIIIQKGKIVMDDTPRKVFKQVEKMKALRLDVPQVTEITHKLIKKGINIRDDILNINQMCDELLKIGFNNKNIEKVEKKEKKFETIIEIKNLSHIYSENTVFEKKALENINLKIGKGEFVGLIGHTGSGKSTLIQHLNALIKPTSGNIFLNGIDINSDKSKLKQIRQKIGLVFQYPEHQLFETTVFKDVAFAPKNMGVEKDEIEKRVINALNAVGIDKNYYKKSPFELSGGQKRRVAIAGILAMNPEVLVLDEPTAGLDPYGRDEILNLIKDMRDRLNITVILVSHSMEDVSKYADKIVVMYKGKVEFEGSPDYVFSHFNRLKEIGLSIPQTSMLMNMLIENGINLPKNIYTVDEAVYLLSNMLIKN